MDAIGDLAIEHYHELGKETRLFAPFYTKDASFYQDRLGTNTGKTQKRARFCSKQGHAVAGREDMAGVQRLGGGE